jgi:F-type H+-transporting ATPase subunit epsilon
MKIEIISPEKTIVMENARSVILPAADGEMQALDNHAPAIVLLEKGNIKIEKENPMNILLFNTGYAHITSEKITILIEDF